MADPGDPHCTLDFVRRRRMSSFDAEELVALLVS
jgi:hypothetical protein